MIRTLIATMAVTLFGVLAFAELTRGFTVLTAESARRQMVRAEPIAIPALVGNDQQGSRRELYDRDDDRVTIVDFIYTRCTSICSVLGSSYQQMQAAIVDANLTKQVRLVTVSFDPEHDTAETIRDYAQRLRANPDVWTLLTPVDGGALHRTLALFGVVVTPAPQGQFIHNAAFHLIDRHGRLARIIDISHPDEAIRVARQLYGAP